MIRRPLLILLLAAAACNSPTRTISGGNNNNTGTRRDGGGGGGADAQAPADAGFIAVDAGFDDSGNPIDGGFITPDLGFPEDTGVPDPSDTGTDPGDTGNEPADTGLPIDTGLPLDSGVPMPDLTVAWTHPPPSNIRAGDNLTLTIQASNGGAAVAPPSEVTIDIYATATGPSSARQLAQLGVRSLRSGDVETLTVTVALPTDLLPGGFTLRGRIDPAGFVAESDESNNEIEVGVTIPGVEAIPPRIAFGGRVVGCGAGAAHVNVQNSGGVAATITSVALVGSTEFSLGATRVPIPLMPGAGVRIDVAYDPIDNGGDMARIDLGVDQIRPMVLSIPLTGTGSTAPARTDTFTQTTGNPKADILFIIDNSGSMAEEQAALSQQFPTFLSNAQSVGLDFRIAFTTTDVTSTGARGAFVGTPAILTPTTPNLAAVFAQRVNQGTSGSGNEQGLEASRLALTPPLSNGVNAGFIRSDARLVIIYLSDEEDTSPMLPPAYIGALTALKPQGEMQANAIVGTVNPSCMGAGGSAMYGSRYLAVSMGTSGVAVSICESNWGPALTNLGTVNRQTSFRLSSNARRGTITVRVNGVVVPETSGATTNWTFDGQSTVTFVRSAVPPSGATIEIAYTAGC